MVSPQARFEQLEAPLHPLRRQLLTHPLYGHLKRPEDLRLFMEHHIFAVWDFMSLLKALQAELTGLSVPWLPAKWPFACRMINEIVLAEESDEDGSGGFASHFELYYRAMVASRADVERIDRFLEALGAARDLDEAFDLAEVSPGVREFVRRTFEVIESRDPCAIASAFTFGREDLLPQVFQRIVDELNARTAGSFELFNYYLGRHIELDGETHGPLARQLMEVLCGDDDSRWASATQAAVAALEARLALWNEIHHQLCAIRLEPGGVRN